jgi:Flp pilus assembly protein TadG
MAAERTRSALRKKARFAALDRSGQSVLEFMLMLPLMLGLAMLMIRVNTVIQMGIVNQQYARAQALYTAGNGAEYPRREQIVSVLSGVKYNQLVIGISDEEDPLDGDLSTQKTATAYKIVPASVTGYNDSAQTEAQQRGNIRVRTSVSLCLPILVSGGMPIRPVFPLASDAQRWSMSDIPKQFSFCSAPQPYVDDSNSEEFI